MMAREDAKVLVVAALTERVPGELRVALVPEVVERLVAQGFEVLVEAGAGAGAFHDDDAYVRAGAKVGPLDDVLARADVILAVRRPDAALLARLRPGQALIGMLDARLAGPERAELDEAAARGVLLLSLDLLPRTLPRAQTMDALSSQASVAGYRAAIVAAEAFGRYFPMMITAAGTARPAKVLVLGAGVAGLQAIGTARRLGAQVTGYDVRPAARDEVKSMGAAFLTTATTVAAGDGGGGYARALTPEEGAAQRAELDAAIRKFDVIITTAQVPGGKPPVLVSAETVAEATLEHHPDIVGMSALLTTTMRSMREAAAAVRATGIPTRIIVGGAPISDEFAADINADGWALDAGMAVDVAKRLLASPAQ